MAKLISEDDDLVCDIWYNGVRDDWYYYRITLLWKGKPVVNPALRYLANDGNPKVEFGFYHHEGDGLRRIFDHALKTGIPCVWDGMEELISLALFPGGSWPYHTPPKFHLLRTPLVVRTLEVQYRDIPIHFDPDESWTIMFFIDSQNFVDAEMLTGNGIILTLSTTRKEVERFRKELEVEHEQLMVNPDKEKGSLFS